MMVQLTKQVKNNNNSSKAVTFSQNTKYDDSWHKTAICHRCGLPRHIKPNCKKTNAEAVESLLKSGHCNNCNGTKNSNNEEDDEDEEEEEEKKKVVT